MAPRQAAGDPGGVTAASAPPIQPPAFHLFAATVRQRRLRLAGLSPVARLLAALALGSVGLSGSVVLFLGFGGSLPGGSHLYAAWGPIGRATIVAGYLGFAVAAAAATAAVLESRPRLPRATFLLVALAGATVAVYTTLAGRDVASANRGFADGDEPLYATASPVVPQVLGYVGLGAALLLPLLPLDLLRRWRWAGPALASAPFLLSFAAYLGADSAPLNDELVAQWPQSLQAAVGQSIVVQAVVGIGFLLAALVYWQVVEGARAARDSSIVVSRFTYASPSVLTVLLTLKLTWISAGLVGVLPSSLGGASPIWDASRDDGLLSWLLAAAAAAGAAWWLARERRTPVGEHSFVPAAAIVIAGLMLIPVVAALMSMLGSIELLWRQLGLLPASAGLRTVEAASWMVDQQLRAQSAFVFAACLVGAVLLAVWRRRAFALFLIAFGVWALPRAIHIVLGSEAAASGAGSLERITFDAAITTAVVVLAVLWRLDRQRGAGPGPLIVVLLASTFVTYTGAVASLFASGHQRALFYTFLVLPIAYQFFLDSEALTEPTPQRSSRLLATLAAAAALLAVLAVRVGLHTAGPDIPTEEDVGRVLFLVPFAALLVAAALSPSRATGGRPAGAPDAV